MSPRAHSKRAYLVVFGVLALLTALEVGLKYLGLPHAATVAGLVALAIAKASLVALFFMHLKWESRAFQWTVGITVLLPAIFAAALIFDALQRRVVS